MASGNSPVRETRMIVQDSGDPGYSNRLLVGTPATGNVRIEWVQARYSQLVPINWSTAQLIQYMGGYVPLRYQVADAQNLIVKEAIDKDYEWLFLLEHDVVLPRDTFVRLNHYMHEAQTPVVSGLYFSRAYPSEPMVFRGRGNSFYTSWRMGDRVWCDGVPTGCLLIHMGVLRAMWNESEEYDLKGIRTRRVFNTPREGWYNPQTNQYNATSVTSDLAWCDRVIAGDYLRKAGWGDAADRQWPFLVDTELFCYHINPDGTRFPDGRSLAQWQKEIV